MRRCKLKTSVPVSDRAWRTRTVVERLVREPYRRLIVLKNNRPVAVISGLETDSNARAKNGSLRAVLLRKKDLICSIAHARGEERPDTDIDLLVQFAPGRSVLDLIGLENDLASVLGRKVEVITEKGAKPRVLKAALRDAIRIV